MAGVSVKVIIPTETNHGTKVLLLKEGRKYGLPGVVCKGNPSVEDAKFVCLRLGLRAPNPQYVGVRGKCHIYFAGDVHGQVDIEGANRQKGIHYTGVAFLDAGRKVEIGDHVRTAINWNERLLE